MPEPLDMARLHRRAHEINTNLKSPLHPHEPEIPPALDADGRCWVCKAQSAERDLRALAYALFRSNIDWADAARTCGDPKCHGDCRHIAEIRRIVAEWDGGTLPTPYLPGPSDG